MNRIATKQHQPYGRQVAEQEVVEQEAVEQEVVEQEPLSRGDRNGILFKHGRRIPELVLLLRDQRRRRTTCMPRRRVKGLRGLHVRRERPPQTRTTRNSPSISAT